MLRFLRRTFGRRSMQRHGGRAAAGARGGPGFRGRDERDGGMRAISAAASPGGAGLYPPPTLLPPPVHSGGATVHIPAAGDSKSLLSCKVQLLDGTDVGVDLPVSV
ncbi:hypothetical protein XELAEV_18033341mg [Xenopus laevis]|uniref:Uncharacterized protein n=1 Tax=Xenopus laevis TaxID=8355 RepID=A0A974CJQ9_XENLA|nr:hypothetical protein XELAEV_18033341mg [Xenopus laevis]